jgi:hypothetical protein
MRVKIGGAKQLNKEDDDDDEPFSTTTVADWLALVYERPLPCS